MKITKISTLGLVTAFSLVLGSCNLMQPKDQNQNTGDDQSETMMTEPLSEDTDLTTVETELNDTELNEFDAELNDLDQEINNL